MQAVPETKILCDVGMMLIKLFLKEECFVMGGMMLIKLFFREGELINGKSQVEREYSNGGKNRGTSFSQICKLDIPRFIDNVSLFQ